jgi:hypothetical protein
MSCIAVVTQEGLNLDFTVPADGNRFNFVVDSGGEVAEKPLPTVN